MYVQKGAVTESKKGYLLAKSSQEGQMGAIALLYEPANFLDPFAATEQNSVSGVRPLPTTPAFSNDMLETHAHFAQDAVSHPKRPRGKAQSCGWAMGVVRFSSSLLFCACCCTSTDSALASGQVGQKEVDSAHTMHVLAVQGNNNNHSPRD